MDKLLGLKCTDYYKKRHYHVAIVVDDTRGGPSPGCATVCDEIITFAHNVTFDTDQDFDDVDAAYQSSTEEDYQKLVVIGEVAIMSKFKYLESNEFGPSRMKRKETFPSCNSLD